MLKCLRLGLKCARVGPIFAEYLLQGTSTLSLYPPLNLTNSWWRPGDNCVMFIPAAIYFLVFGDNSFKQYVLNLSYIHITDNNLIQN